jgi:hypothetical protein
MAELGSAEGNVLQLMDALRHAPDKQGRSAAAHALALLAHDQPAHCAAMVEGGALELVLGLLIELGNSATAPLEPAQELACVLLRRDGCGA